MSWWIILANSPTNSPICLYYSEAMQYIAYFSPTCQRDLEHLARALTFLKALILHKYVQLAIFSPRCSQQHYPYLHISLRGKPHFMAACISFTIVWSVAQPGIRACLWRQSKNISLSLLCPTMLDFFSQTYFCGLSKGCCDLKSCSWYFLPRTGYYTHTLRVCMWFFLNRLLF